MRILGISCWYHDAGACLVEDGRIVAAAEEERFTRKKHDASFPENAIRYVMAEGRTREVDAVAFYDKPIRKLHRILETHLATAPRGLRPFLKSVPTWVREKLWIEPEILDGLDRLGFAPPKELLFMEHHESHAASAYYPSPFDSAAILTLDGVGEWHTATLADGDGAKLSLLQSLDYPHSLGLLYSAFTYFCGFRVNSGEYKLMGLAPYGEGTYTKTILEKLVDLKADGSFRLNTDYFGFLDGLTMTNDRFAALFGGPALPMGATPTKRERDLAKSVQEVTEEIVLRMARHARKTTGRKNLCLAGGVALNCVANGRLLREKIFDDLWIQPAAGDAGGALGAALAAYHRTYEQPRTPVKPDAMNGAYLGPAFDDDEIRAWLDAKGFPYETLAPDAWADRLAALVADEKVVALCQGRMEFGPRALGNRSIIGDPRSPRIQSTMNLKIKFRESFRPFAPAVLEEKVGDWFELDRTSPYMLLVADVRKEKRVAPTGDEASLDLKQWVNRVRSELPAITHVDYSARVQTVSKATNPRFFSLISAFEQRTGCPVVVNTSFNVRGEPIVCTPEDAYRCFMGSAIDHLVLGSFLLSREGQPAWTGPSGQLAAD